MQITHEEAHKWIHLKMDGALNLQQRKTLESHLDICVDCSKYAKSIQKMESVLHPLLQRQWEQQPIPLSIATLIPRRNSKTSEGMLLATRIAAIGVMFITFMFSTWQYTMSRPSVPAPAMANVPSMPIPATFTYSTSTETGCNAISYLVDKNDTLASIASQFSIGIEEIIQANALTSNTMITGQKLVIPICTTPTSTVDEQTTTFTPVLGRTTSTPGG